jgi:hypothetical protein
VLLRGNPLTCLTTCGLLESMNACHCASFAAAARTSSRCSRSCEAHTAQWRSDSSRRTHRVYV